MTLFEIWDALILALLIGGLIWAFRHRQLLKRKILENDAMPREAVRGNIVVLVLAVLVFAVAIHFYLLF